MRTRINRVAALEGFIAAVALSTPGLAMVAIAGDDPAATTVLCGVVFTGATLAGVVRGMYFTRRVSR